MTLPVMKCGYPGHRCPICRGPIDYEIWYFKGYQNGYWRCVICGERWQDYEYDMNDNCRLRHSYPTREFKKWARDLPRGSRKVSS